MASEQKIWIVYRESDSYNLMAFLYYDDALTFCIAMDSTNPGECHLIDEIGLC